MRVGWSGFGCRWAQAHVAGVGVDWAAVFAGSGGRRVELPTYAFQRQRFWLACRRLGLVDVAGLGLVGAGHALLGAVVERPDSGGVVLTGRLSLGAQPWLADHAVAGVVLFPGAGFVELACGPVMRSAARWSGVDVGGAAGVAAGGVQVQVVVGAAVSRGSRAVSVYSRGGRPMPGGCCTPRACWGSSRSRVGGGFVGVAAGGGGDVDVARRLCAAGRAWL